MKIASHHKLKPDKLNLKKSRSEKGRVRMKDQGGRLSLKISTVPKRERERERSKSLARTGNVVSKRPQGKERTSSLKRTHKHMWYHSPEKRKIVLPKAVVYEFQPFDKHNQPRLSEGMHVDSVSKRLKMELPLDRCRGCPTTPSIEMKAHTAMQESQRIDLAAEHRAGHEMLRKRLLCRVDRMIAMWNEQCSFRAGDSPTIEEARLWLDETIYCHEDMLVRTFDLFTSCIALYHSMGKHCTQTYTHFCHPFLLPLCYIKHCVSRVT